MNNENKVTLAVAVVAVLIPSVLAFGLGWPVWVWLLLVLVALLVPLAMRKHANDRLLREQQMREFEMKRAAKEEPEPEPEPEFTQHQLSEVSLPSADRDYRFVFAATVHWRRTLNGVGVPYTDPKAVADELVVTQARETVAVESPDNVDVARHRLNASLGGVLRDRSGHVEAYAENTSLALSEEDSQRLRRLADVRKDEAVWEHERHFERNKRAYLREDVLQDTGTALVWLLAQEDNERAFAMDGVRGAVELIGKLARLTSVVNNSEVPRELVAYLDPQDGPVNGHAPFHQGAHPGLFDYVATVSEATVGEHLISAVRKHSDDEEQRALLADRLIRLMDAIGSPDIADTVRRELEPPRGADVPDVPDQWGPKHADDAS